MSVIAGLAVAIAAAAALPVLRGQQQVADLVSYLGIKAED